MNRIVSSVIGSLAVIGLVLAGLTIIDAALVDSRCYAQPTRNAPPKTRPAAPTGTIGGKPARDPALRVSALTASECKDLGGKAVDDSDCPTVRGMAVTDLTNRRCVMPNGSSSCINEK